jgi:hypothetical protein
MCIKCNQTIKNDLDQMYYICCNNECNALEICKNYIYNGILLNNITIKDYYPYLKCNDYIKNNTLN